MAVSANTRNKGTAVVNGVSDEITGITYTRKDPRKVTPIFFPSLSSHSNHEKSYSVFIFLPGEPAGTKSRN